MTKRELVGEIAEAHGLLFSHARALLDALFEAVTERLIRVGRQTVPGLGTLTTDRRPPREMHDPRTGRIQRTGTRISVRFSPSDPLRAIVRGQHTDDVPDPRVPRSDPLVEAVWRATGQQYSGKLIGEVILHTASEIGTRLRDGGRCTLSGFGTFTVTQRPARAGRNPRTGAPLTVPAGLRFGFRPARGFKDRLVAGPGEAPLD